VFAIDTLRDWYNLLTASGHAATGRPDLEWRQSNREVPMKYSEAVLSVVLALGLLAAPVPSSGQPPAKVYRIGLLSTATPPAPTDTSPQHCPIKGDPLWQAMVEGLRERGYLPGQNLVIECRWTEGRDEHAPTLAAELVSLKVDLIVTIGNPATRAAKQATSTIPIVMVLVLDPVGFGIVASLAHPGGNLTGLAEAAGAEIAGKRLQLLKEAVPTVARVAILGYSADLVSRYGSYWTETQAAARALDLTLQSVGVQDPKDLEGAFSTMTKARAEALLVLPSPPMYIHAQRIVALAAQSRLPAMYPDRDFVEAGGLLSYAVNGAAIRRRVGFYVDRILTGAKPGDLPVEQATKFDLLINLKTAKALGLTIPQSLLDRADEVIQ
jgi:putative ABC transport system substrate-binding protein